MKRIVFIIALGLLSPWAAFAGSCRCPTASNFNPTRVDWPRGFSSGGGEACFYRVNEQSECKDREIYHPERVSRDGIVMANAYWEVGPCTYLPNAERCESDAASISTKADIVEFQPLVAIPGGTTFGTGQRVLITSDTIGRYIVDLIKFLTGAVAIMAVVMIMFSGLRWVFSGGSPEKITRAKEGLVNSLIGVALAFGSWMLLYVINPALTELPSIAPSYVAGVVLESEEDVEGTVAANIIPVERMIDDEIRGWLIPKSSAVRADDQIALALAGIARELKVQGYTLVVASAWRDSDMQRRQIAANCPRDAARSSDCTPPTCLLKNGPGSCPHTTGRAVDAWGGRPGSGACLDRDQCLRDVAACRRNGCQAAVIRAFRARGFCNLDSEPWHFERPAMSSRCTL